MIKKFYLPTLLFLTYALIAVIFTYPLIFNFNSDIYGYPGDNFAYLNYLWKIKRGISGIDAGIPAPLLDITSRFFTLIFNEVVAFNLLSFLRFSLAGLAMYFLCSKVFSGFESSKITKFASFLAGFVFSFSLYSLWQGMVHIDLALVFWLPLFVLCLINLWEKANLKSAFWAAGTFAFTFSTCFYYGYFLALFSIGFIVFVLISKFIWKTKIPLFLFLAAGFLSLLLISPILLSAFRNSGSALVAKTLESRGPEQIISLGAKPWDYLMPSVYHPIFGGWVKDFYEYNQQRMQWYLQSAYLPERVVFLGFIPLILALIGFWWGKKDERFKKYVWLFGFLTLWCIWVSAPSYTFIKGIKIYFPSYFLYKFFPMFRVYARMGILVLLCIAVLASIGLVLLVERLQQIKNVKIRKTLVPCLLPLVACFIFFETLNFPPFHVVDVSLRPPVYEWLADQSGNVKIAEYPVDTSNGDFGGGCPDWLDPEVRREYPGYYADLFQRVHRKEVLDYGSLPAEEKADLAGLSSSDAYEVLSLHGVDYIIVHTRDYFPQKNPFDECQLRRIMNKPKSVYEKFGLVEEFEDGVVYELL